MTLTTFQFPLHRLPNELGAIFAVLKNGVDAVKRALREARRGLLMVDLFPAHAGKINDIWYVDKPVVGDIIYRSEREIDMHTQDQGNNETISRGIFELHGKFTALTFSESRTFKTRNGAEAWLSRRGYNPDGSRK
jgi:hypothetical protein